MRGAEVKEAIGADSSGENLADAAAPTLPKVETAASLTEEDKLAAGARVAATNGLTEESAESFAWSAPAKPKVMLKESEEGQHKLRFFADSEDEYVAAENYFKNGEYLQAIPAYQNFIEANVDDERALKARYQIGESYYQMGDYPLALSNFAPLTEIEQPEVTTAKIAAYGVAEKKDEEEALERKAGRGITSRARRSEESRKTEIVRDEKAAPETREELISRAIFRQAQSYEHLGSSEEALANYKKYVEKYPQGEYIPLAKEKITQMKRRADQPAQPKEDN